MHETTNDTSVALPILNDDAVGLHRDIFLRNLLRELSGALEDIVGLEDASGFISVVGQRLGEQINENYKAALQVDGLSRALVPAVLVDLKRRIQGDFFVIEQDTDRIVLGNRACPFGEKVLGRPSLCMMTSNVFGTITAENLGYARVSIEQSIAKGDHGCRVIVYLKPEVGADDQVDDMTSREYLKAK